MADTFYWYDYETTGVDPARDRVVQFAGIRTDLDFNPIGSPDEFYCKLHDDVLPHPEACLVTGISPQHATHKGLLECDFIARIHQQFSTPQTCVVGYNSIRFDDEFTRYLLYRNFFDPYAREWKSGNSRWDLIDVVRLTHALRPEGIVWPTREGDLASFKLEELTKANDIAHESAHDALSDVRATIALAKLIKQKQPKLFEYCLSLRKKNTVKSLLNWQLLKPIVHVSNKIPAQRGCLAIMLPLAIHPTNPNGVICYDLAHNPDDLFALDVEDIRDRIFTPQSELPEDCERIALKTIHINKSPIVAPLGVLKDVDLERIGMDYATNKANLEKFKSQASLIQKVQEVFHQEFDNSDDDVDGLLYSGFFSPQDKQNFNHILAMKAKQVFKSDLQYKDPRAEELVFRYMARNHPEVLSSKQAERWIENCAKRIAIRFGENAQLWFEKLNLLRLNTESKQHLAILDAVEKDTIEKLSKLN